jgi:hypothetical protein
MRRLITAAGLRWPAEENFEFGKDYFGLDQSQVRLDTALTRHTVLVMAALAVCVIAAARARSRTDTQAPPPAGPDDLPPDDPGLIPLTVAEVKRGCVRESWLRLLVDFGSTGFREDRCR